MAKGGFKITGIKELQKKMEELEKATQKKVLRSISRKSLNIYVKEARQNAPVDSGNLKKSIGNESAKRTGREKVAIVAGPRRKKGSNTGKGYHAHLLEFGTAKMRAKPYLRPAWDTKNSEVLDKYKSQMWEEIEKHAKK